MVGLAVDRTLIKFDNDHPPVTLIDRPIDIEFGLGGHKKSFKDLGEEEEESEEEEHHFRTRVGKNEQRFLWMKCS